MKKIAGNYKVYLYKSYGMVHEWQLSGNWGLCGKTFTTKLGAMRQAKKLGAEGLTYKVATRTPTSFSGSFVV